MQTPKQFYFIIFLLLQLGGLSLYAQDPIREGEINLPIEEEKPTVLPSTEEGKITPTTPEKNTKVTDTIRPKEDLKHIMEYYGEDYVFLDKKINYK